jgi:hypothetical protein
MTDVLLIPKESYPAMTTSGTFSFNPTLGGGNVSFSGHDVYNYDPQWGPQLAFDNSSRDYGWCNTPTSPLRGSWTFPRSVTMNKIFIVPRGSNDNFPTSVTVYKDGASIGTFSPSTIGAANGLQISYSGTGYYIIPNSAGTTWELIFNSTNAYIGKIEFWGY